MKKLITLILLFSILSFSFSLTSGAWFVDKNGNNITSIDFDQVLYGYVDQNPNGYVYMCFPFNLTGIPIALYWTDQNYNYSTAYQITVNPVNVTPMEKIGNYYCSKTDLDISSLKAVYPGIPTLFEYVGNNWYTVNNWYPPLLNGSYYGYIQANGIKISVELSRVMDSRGKMIDQYLNESLNMSKLYTPTIVLNLVNLSSGKAMETKLVTTKDTVYFSEPNDFGKYGQKYMFYANGLPVHNLNCNTCEGKPDGTPCSFNLFPEDRYGCVTQPGETHNGMCAGGYCHPTCNPSLNDPATGYNSYCKSETDDLGWEYCCPEGNEYHICVADLQTDCPRFCGTLWDKCCPETPTQPLCNQGHCVCLTSGGTECINDNDFVVGQMLNMWDLNNYILSGNPLEYFFLNSTGTFSCCKPNSGCSLISSVPNLPHLCPVLIS